MPFEDLNLGSNTALESAIPSPTQDRMTTPPPGYTPGYTAPVNREYQDSPFYRMGEVLSAIATPAGEMPASIKLRLANHEADLKTSQNKLAWDNFYRQNQIVQETMKIHNREAITQGISLLPQFKAIVHSVTEPTERTAMAKHLGRILDNYGPGLGKVMDMMDKNPAHILGYDMLLEHPVYGPQFQPLADTMSYEKQMDDPGIKQLVENLGRDTIPLIISRFTTDEHKQLTSGKMSQTDFVKAYDRATIDESFGPVKPQKVAFAKAALNTAYGEQVMEGFGVQTYAMTARKNAKEKPEGQQDLAKELKNESIIKAKTELEDSKANPGKYSAAYTRQLEEDLRIHAGLQQKEANQGINLNNATVQRFDINTKGKYGRYEDLARLPEGPVKEEAYAAAATARKEADKAAAMSQMNARMATPGDTSNYIYADQLLKAGRAVGVKGEVSEGELRTNRNYLKVTPDQKKQLSEFNITQQSSHDIFDLATKAFKGSPTVEVAADAVLRKEDSILNSPLKAIAKAQYPDLAIYVARREATLGKFARSVSGEVGVLTDQDVVRVRNLFPVGGDNAYIRTAKRKALDALINLNRKFATEVLSGELLPEDVERLKRSDKYQSAVNGILGSVEGLSKQQNVAPEYANPSNDKPKSGVNSLMQDLEAGR